MTRLLEEDLADLPEPVQRSLRRTGAIGRDIPKLVTIRQQGRIRSSIATRWLRFKATQTYDVAAPGFRWDARLKVAGVTVGRAIDVLEAGKGGMRVRLLGLLKVLDASGPEIDQGSLLRWLQESMFFPAVWATPLITWEPVDDRRAVATVSAGAQTVNGEFRFDAEGRLVDFYADRYRTTDDGYQLTGWSTPLQDHRRCNGLEVPGGGAGVWHLEDGEFEYVQIRLTKLAYT